MLCHAEAEGYVIVNSYNVRELDDEEEERRRRRMKEEVIWIGMRMRTRYEH